MALVPLDTLKDVSLGVVELGGRREPSNEAIQRTRLRPASDPNDHPTRSISLFAPGDD
jgi:hypothetical protein